VAFLLGFVAYPDIARSGRHRSPQTGCPLAVPEALQAVEPVGRWAAAPALPAGPMLVCLKPTEMETYAAG